MRSRTVDSTTVPKSSQSSGFLITEKGLRACGATSMMQAAAKLHQEATELEQAAKRLNQDMPRTNGAKKNQVVRIRRATVCARFRDNKRVPEVRISGLWLEGTGFEIGRKVEILVEAGQLTLRAL